MDLRIITKLGLKQFDKNGEFFIFEDKYLCAESKYYIIFEKDFNIFKIKKLTVLELSIDELRMVLNANLNLL